MTISDTNPFQALPDRRHNACVSNYMQFAELARSYACSGDELVDSSLRDHSLLDVHVYAVCFLYRHALELYLKEVIWKSHYAATGEKRFAAPPKSWRELKRHRLSELWRSALESTKRLPGDFPLDSQQRQALSDLLMEFERHDPGSDSFRYPIGTSGRTHPELGQVNVRALREQVHKVFEWLAIVAEKVGHHCEQRSEMRRAQQ
jgi:hypothetical protein